MILKVFYNETTPRSTITDADVEGLEVVLHLESNLCLSRKVTDERIIAQIKRACYVRKIAKVLKGSQPPTLMEIFANQLGMKVKYDPLPPGNEEEFELSGPIGILIGMVFSDVHGLLNQSSSSSEELLLTAAE